MEASTVIQVYTSLHNLGIRIWIDGGWGVDALLGRQTRHHNDLDIVVEARHLDLLRKYLESQRFHETKLAIARPHNFVLTDENNNEIDIHVIEVDADGHGIYGPPRNHEMYPADSLTGKGKIEGIEVDCISPEYVVKFHSGYELKDKDHQDVIAICDAFNLNIPEIFIRTKK